MKAVRIIAFSNGHCSSFVFGTRALSWSGPNGGCRGF